MRRSNNRADSSLGMQLERFEPVGAVDNSRTGGAVSNQLAVEGESEHVSVASAPRDQSQIRWICMRRFFDCVTGWYSTGS